ncbi:unnamed protein product [Peronospora destructor]|uniref:J domain-containing protein n=1 Tax=Peronospora destructor TaxID=86335 RepID=A0AAV0UT19_9STRA|nr:unnamed protein product [Peronospora destructor]
MSCHDNRKLRDEATTNRQRIDNRKVRAGQAILMQGNSPDLIDLTTEDDKQDNVDNVDHVSRDPMEVPAHLESDDYFQVLSLSRSASESDVKRAYRKLAVQWHPDKNRLNPRAEEVFKRISEAYEVLSDLEKRKHYEEYKKAGVQRGRPTQTTEGFGFKTSRAANGFSTRRARDIFEAFFGAEDPFAAFYGSDQLRRGSRRVRNDPFESMGFGGMGVGMTMPGFGQMGGMSMMDQFFSNGFEGMNGTSAGAFSSSTTSSSSMFTDQNGTVIQQKTTTTKGLDGRMETVTEEYWNGKLINSSSSATSRLADVERMQVGGSSNSTKRSYQRRRSSNSRLKYYGI